jgi:hypothetical protein
MEYVTFISGSRSLFSKSRLVQRVHDRRWETLPSGLRIGQYQQHVLISGDGNHHKYRNNNISGWSRRNPMASARATHWRKQNLAEGSDRGRVCVWAIMLGCAFLFHCGQLRNPLVLQICTTRQPFQGMPDVSVLLLIMKDEHPSRPTEIECGDYPMSNEMWRIVNQCWASKPMDRPDMPSVLRSLRNLI